MDKRRLIYYVLGVLVMFSIFTISPWYLIKDTPYYIVNEDVTCYSDLEAEKIVKDYNPEKTYYNEIKTQVLVSKSKIPFIHNRVEVKKISERIYSKKTN